MIVDEPFFITLPYDTLLRALHHLYKASAAQLCRMCNYSDNTVKLVKARLRTLADYGYVKFDARPTTQYRSPYYYVLDNKGIEYIKSIGFMVNSSYCPAKEIGQSYLHLLHHLEVNDMLIAASNLEHQVSGYILELFMVERELSSEPFNALWHGKPYDTVPDLFLDFRQVFTDGRQQRTPVLIEHDGGTEGEETIRRKVHAYSAMISSDWYKTRYGVNSITIAFTTFKGEKRRDTLRGWAREELKGESRSVGTSFLFSTHVQPPIPKHIWLARCWYSPYIDDEPIEILGGVD